MSSSLIKNGDDRLVGHAQKNKVLVKTTRQQATKKFLPSFPPRMQAKRQEKEKSQNRHAETCHRVTGYRLEKLGPNSYILTVSMSYRDY